MNFPDRIKKLFLKLQFDTYLTATFTIYSENRSKLIGVSLHLTVSIIEPVSPVSE